MPTYTTNYNIPKPLVNDPQDEDLWGDYLNDGMDIIDSTLNAIATASPASTIPTGSGMDYWGSTAPDGWLFAYGQAVSRTTYAPLFTAIGTVFGGGDGSTTFNLPDKRGRASFGKDDMGGTSADRLTAQSGGINGDVLGAVGGAETHTLTTAELAIHSHTGLTIPASEDDNPDPPLNGSIIGNNLSGSTVTFSSATTGNAGSGNAHNNLPPGIVCNYIIKT